MNKKNKLSLFSALATVLDMAEETLENDVQGNAAARMLGHFDTINVKAERAAIARVSQLYKLLQQEQEKE